MFSRSTLLKLSVGILIVASLGWYLQPAFDPLGSGSDDRVLHDMGETFEVEGLLLTVVPPNESAPPYSATATLDGGYFIGLNIRTVDKTTARVDLTEFELTNTWRYPYELEKNATLETTSGTSQVVSGARNPRISEDLPYDHPVTDLSNATVKGERNFLLVYDESPFGNSEAWFRVKNQGGRDHYVNITTAAFAEEYR